jgi:hypothetical protein
MTATGLQSQAEEQPEVKTIPLNTGSGTGGKPPMPPFRSSIRKPRGYQAVFERFRSMSRHALRLVEWLLLDAPVPVPRRRSPLAIVVRRRRQLQAAAANFAHPLGSGR